MPNTRRIALDWKKLFAFEQMERDQAKTAQVSARLGAKIGDKAGIKKAG